MSTDLQQTALVPSKTPFDVDTELQKLLGKDPLILDLPKTIEKITEVLYKLRRFTVQVIAARLKRTPPGAVEEILWKQLATFLHAMSNLEFIDPKMKSQAQLDKGLQAIFNPAFNFPKEYALVARHIYEKLEARRWGADEAEPEDDVEDGVVEDSSAGGNTGGTAAKDVTSAVLLAHSDFPADNDPIYGLNGIMHHILRIRGPKMVSYQLNPHYKSKDAKVFGNNGLAVGDCWPNQMALLRDGAHGQRMGGISGSALAGTYSIVVSGLYDDLDKDEGEQLFYSGSNSHNNRAPEPVTSNKTKALERSITTRKPVRVFRSSQGRWKYVPRAGLRYDGLYIITGMTTERNGNGGGYKRFKLERIQDQDDILTHKPTQDLIKLFERVRHGYTRTRQSPTLV